MNLYIPFPYSKGLYDKHRLCTFKQKFVHTLSTFKHFLQEILIVCPYIGAVVSDHGHMDKDMDRHGGGRVAMYCYIYSYALVLSPLSAPVRGDE